MMWMWVSAIVILLGAELNSEIDTTLKRSTVGADEQPLVAVMADTVGKATS